MDLSQSEGYKTPSYADFDDLDRQYWKTVNKSVPIYGSEVDATLFDDHCKTWNLNRLDSILDYVREDYGVEIGGVTTPYLYFGMWKSTFAFHPEDMDLYSINYLHYGAPKTWLSVPRQYTRKLEDLSRRLFPANYEICSNPLRHKTTVISPEILSKNGIPFNQTTQQRNEFIVTFPLGYHAGYNNGFNIAESTNFATTRWIDFGKRAELCKW